MFLKILVLRIIYSTAVESANILAIFPTTLTGDGMGFHLMNELVARNHDVTVLNLFSTESYYGYNNKKNYSDIPLDNTWKVFIDLIDDDYGKIYHEGLFDGITYTYQKAYELTEELLSDSTFQSLKNSDAKKFDVIVMEYYLNDAALGIGSFLGIPTVLLSSKPSSFHVNHIFANPGPASYVPHALTGYTGFMSFWERLNNHFYNLFTNFYRRFYMAPKHDRLLKKYISQDLSLGEVMNNIDLLLINSHPAVTEPVPHTPNMIEIGGFHIQQKTLPNKIRNYMDKAINGIIIFSVRFYFGITQNDYDLLQTMARAFEMSEQQVLWHFDNGIQIELPNKLEFYQSQSKKFPDGSKLSTRRLFSLLDGGDNYTYEDIQHGLLAHPNTKALFSQGDLNDLLEAVYFGVPIVGIPINREQKSNIKQAVERGYAVSIPYEGLTETDVVVALEQIIDYPEFTIKAREASKYMTEQIAKPMDVAIHWIEFVIHQGGAKNLQSPGVLLHWYKRNMLDIVVVVVIIDIILFLIFYYIFKHIITATFRKIRKMKCGPFKKYSKLENE